MTGPRRIRLLAEASEDLIGLEAYLRREAGAAIAVRAITQLSNRIDDLVLFPESGRAAPRLTGAVRLAVVRPWVVLYEYLPDENVILVRRILDGRRNLPDILP